MSQSARPSTFTSGKAAVVAAVLITAVSLVVLLLVSLKTPAVRQQASARPSPAARNVSTAALTLEVDLTSNKLRLRMEGTTVWDARVEVDSDSGSVAEFADDMKRDAPGGIEIRRIHLFGASRPVSDSILNIVAWADNLPVQKLQRYVPERFLIELSNGGCIDVVTDISGQSISPLDNAFEEGRYLWRTISGDDCFRVRIPGKEGMSLYGACRPGIPVVLR